MRKKCVCEKRELPAYTNTIKHFGTFTFLSHRGIAVSTIHRQMQLPARLSTTTRYVANNVIHSPCSSPGTGTADASKNKNCVVNALVRLSLSGR